MPTPVISADSHVTEHPDAFRKYVAARDRDAAPHVVRNEGGGDLYVIPGIAMPIPVGLVAAAGKDPKDISLGGKFEDWYRSGWDPAGRAADQARDGVDAEILYPTVGMVLCNHEDLAYKRTYMQAYNRWIAEYCASDPRRLIGVGQTAMRSPEEGIGDLHAIAALGLRGVMLPGVPGQADYHDPVWDPFWTAAVETDLPLSFHILTTPDTWSQRARGPFMNQAVATIRSNQDIMGMLIFGGVFERHPKLRIVCVEADAGWAPHWMYRMDHYYDRHRYLRHTSLSRRPSEIFREHVYLTFQDDWTAFQTIHLQNPARLMWGNDFPHSDSTWPRSQQVLAEQAAHLDAPTREAITGGNVAALYHLAAPAGAA